MILTHGWYSAIRPPFFITISTTVAAMAAMTLDDTIGAALIDAFLAAM
jgi:hypothetical protein